MSDLVIKYTQQVKKKKKKKKKKKRGLVIFSAEPKYLPCISLD